MDIYVWIVVGSFDEVISVAYTVCMCWVNIVEGVGYPIGDLGCLGFYNHNQSQEPLALVFIFLSHLNFFLNF